VLAFLKDNTGHCIQALKTGIAALLCLYITQCFGLTQGYWAAISSIIVLQSHMGATIKASLGRLMATAIGAAIGAAFFAAFGKSYLCVSIAIALAAVLCASRHLRDSYRLAGSTVMIVMFSAQFNTPWMTAMERFIEVSLGILVALVVSKFLWPSRARQQLRTEIEQCTGNLFALYKAIIERDEQTAPLLLDELGSNVRKSFRRIHELRQHAIYEQNDVHFSNEMIAAAVSHLRMIRQSVESLELATRECPKSTFQASFEPELDQLLSNISSSFEKLTSAMAMPDENFDASAITEAVEALDRKTSANSDSAIFVDFPVSDVLHFHSFLVSLRSLAVELSYVAQPANAQD
jgi:uncharacterized membrane protein YgaE (UPF0421/DUF939 family)